MLSERERRFVDAYMGEAAGNGTAAAKCAGYKGSAQVLGVQANRLLKKANVLDAIAERRQTLASQSIADAKERREVLTSILRSAEVDPNARIRAIDTANKMDGVYVEKHEHAGKDGKPLIPPGASFVFAVQQIPGSENRT